MAGNEIVLPGMVDLHVHFREPSSNPAETIESGSWGALLGGFALYVDMPNNPGVTTWSEERVLEKKSIIQSTSKVPGALWAGSQPESDNIGQLRAMMKNCVGTKFYTAPTTNNPNDYEAAEFREIAKELHRIDPTKPIALHAGEDNLEDFIGLVARDLDHPLHVCHVNSLRAVDTVVRVARFGRAVTCEVCPHHLFKTSHDEVTEDAFATMMPPLAHQDEAEALFERLVKGDIDTIGTDHAPHPFEKKMQAVHEGGECKGVPGIEFAAALMLFQAMKGRISYERIVEVMSTKPAEIIGMKIRKDTQVTWDLVPYRIESNDQHITGSGWSPYLRMMAGGTVKDVMIGGVPVLANRVQVRRMSTFVTQRGTEI